MYSIYYFLYDHDTKKEGHNETVYFSMYLKCVHFVLSEAVSCAASSLVSILCISFDKDGK